MDKLKNVTDGEEIMRTDKLNARQKEIIKILTKSTINNPITISVIADKLSLSSRTVLREMPKIEAWLDENEFKFIKKPGVGLIIDENLENQQLILELLEVEKIQKEYSKEERKKIIVGELLTAQDPLKLFYFTSQLKVSEGTLSGDLDSIETWLRKFNITLIRKPGLGIYVEGRETDFRKALVNLLYDTINENELMDIIKDSLMNKRNEEVVEFSIHNRLLKFIDKAIIKSIEEIVSDLEEELNVKLADSSYIGLVVHLSLAIQRIKNNEKITMDKDTLIELSKLSEFKIGEKIVKSIEEKFDLDIPMDEVGYITMHLKGAKLRLNATSVEFNLSNLDVKQISYHIISAAEKEFGVYLREDGRLLTDLTNHLVPAISRLKMKLNIRNPLLENIKQNYSREFEMCLKACDILKVVTNLTEIPESEVAYITMHIAAALEKNILDERIPVVIACPTGIGTSKLLASILEREFNNLDVRGTISAINIDYDKLKNQGIELIISTVDLKIDYRYIRVNTIVSEQDKILIDDTIRRILKKKKYEKMTVKHRKKEEKSGPNISKSQIKEISKMGDSILSLIKNVTLKEIDKVGSIKDLIHEGSFVFADSVESALKIEASLMERELISTTYLPRLSIMLLHCKTSCVDDLRFGFIRIKEALVEGDKFIEGGVIALIPENINDKQAEIISEINGALIEKEDFVKTLKEKTESQITDEIEKMLLNFYKRKMEKSLGAWNNG